MSGFDLKTYQRNYKETNKESLREYFEKYYRDHKIHKNRLSKKYHSAHREQIALKSKKYREGHKKEAADYQKQYRQDNATRLAIQKKLYSQKNQKHIADHKKEYRQRNQLKITISRTEKRKTNIQFRLAGNLRSRLTLALKRKSKSGSAVRDLGCTIPELKFYLEGQFQDGMTWANWSLFGWHIDHKVPLDFFDLTDREQFLQAVHYTNLQPMWAKENLEKSNKIDNPQHPTA